MNPPYVTHNDAIMAIAAKDPALASLLIHQHDCIEALKVLATNMGNDLTDMKQSHLAFKSLLERTFYAAVGTLVMALISTLGFVLWQVITHPRWFQ